MRLFKKKLYFPSGKIGGASTMTRKIRFSCHCVRLALRSLAALGQDRRRLNNDKKDKIFLPLYSACTIFAITFI